MLVQSQFRRGGFNYAGVEAGLRMAGIWSAPELFRGLRLMEMAILGYLAEKDQP